LKVPPACQSVATTLVVTIEGDGERWVRSFGDALLVTTQQRRGHERLLERIGGLELDLRLQVENGALHFSSVGAYWRWGRGHCRLPALVAPVLGAWERESRGGGTHVRVEVGAPLLGLLFFYEGRLQAVRDDTERLPAPVGRAGLVVEPIEQAV